jgi:peptide/nickel transport system substrate-binding protein
MRGPRTAVLTSVMAAALVLTGCDEGDHPDPVRAARPSSDLCSGCVSSHGENPVASGPYEVRGAVGGGTVTVLTDHGLDGTLDPAGASDRAAISILSGLVTRSLTQYRFDPQSRQMVLVADLATDVGRHNDDYTKWAFTVRHGARFEDGRRVTPRDVARGIRRCRHGRAFPTSPCLANGPIRSVSVRRRGELMFRFDRPFPDFPYLAAMPALGPVPPGTRAVYGPYARHPVATGPYQIEDYRRGRRLVLLRNPEWDPRTDPARTQYPDRYVIRAGVPDRHIERLLLADQGSAQTTLTLDALDPTSFSTSAQDRLVLGPSLCTTYLAPDNRTITDPRVRRALVWAYPYGPALHAEGLVRGVTAVPATTLVPPGVPGRTPLRVPHHRGFETDPRVARRMLTEAHALGTPLRFFHDATRPGRSLRDALVRSLRASGFDPRPERAPRVLFPEQTPANLPVDLRTTTRCGSWPSGQQWVDPAYRSSHADQTGNLFDNTEAFSHHPMVERGLRHVSSLPLEDQPDAWSRLDRRVLRRWQPVVPLWYGGVAMAHGSRIEGMADDSVRGMPTWTQIWVSPGS